MILHKEKDISLAMINDEPLITKWFSPRCINLLLHNIGEVLSFQETKGGLIDLMVLLPTFACVLQENDSYTRRFQYNSNNYGIRRNLTRCSLR